MFVGHPVSIKGPLSLFCSNHCYIIQQSTKKVSALAASGILQLDSFLLPCPVLSFLFPKSHLMCLVAALRHTLLTKPLLFDSCSVSSCSVPFSSSSLPWVTSQPHFAHRQFIRTLCSYHLSCVSATSMGPHSQCWLPAGQAPIILGIDLCCIDERLQPRHWRDKGKEG